MERDPRRHLVRHYGPYSSRTRGALRARRQAEAAAAAATAAASAEAPAGEGSPSASPPAGTPAPSARSAERAPPASPSRADRARLLRRISEADPLLCCDAVELARAARTFRPPSSPDPAWRWFPPRRDDEPLPAESKPPKPQPELPATDDGAAPREP